MTLEIIFQNAYTSFNLTAIEVHLNRKKETAIEVHLNRKKETNELLKTD
jgi:hypothetical protein